MKKTILLILALLLSLNLVRADLIPNSTKSYLELGVVLILILLVVIAFILIIWLIIKKIKWRLKK